MDVFKGSHKIISAIVVKSSMPFYDVDAGDTFIVEDTINIDNEINYVVFDFRYNLSYNIPASNVNKVITK